MNIDPQAWWKKFQAWRKRPVVPVLRLDGVIGPGGRWRGGLNIAGQARAIEAAFGARRAVAVALVINSPGGSASQSSLIHDRIRALAAEKKLPVLAFVEDVAASGGYWLACAADEIFITPTSILGSIGVISSSLGLAELIGRWGIERRLYTAGERKALLDPFSPQKPEDVERLKALLGQLHDSFRTLVKSRRGERLRGSDEHLFSGEFWVGERVIERGLADGFGDIRTVLRSRFGEQVRLVPVQREREWLHRLGLAGEGRLDGAPAAARPGWAGDLLAAVEERAMWNRFGL